MTSRGADFRRRDEAALHRMMLPGGCPGCGRQAGRLRWMDQGGYVDLFGFDALNHLVGPLGAAAWAGENELSVWICGRCGASGAVAWNVREAGRA
jgi:ribosomal protein L37AE/L43A